MKDERKTNHQNDYMEKIRKRHEHLYGVKLPFEEEEEQPPIYENIERTNLIGWSMVILSIVFGLVMAFIVVSIVQTGDPVGAIVLLLITYGVLALVFIGGWRQIKASTSRESLLKLKKTLIKVCLCIAVAAWLVAFLNATILTRTSTIMYEDISHTEYRNHKEYMVFNDGKLKLLCNSSFDDEIWSVHLFEKDAVYEIQYEWSVLSPHRGKVVKITRKD